MRFGISSSEAICTMKYINSVCTYGNHSVPPCPGSPISNCTISSIEEIILQGLTIEFFIFCRLYSVRTQTKVNCGRCGTFPEASTRDWSPMVLPLRLNLHPSPSPLIHYHILGYSLIHYLALVPLAPQGHISLSLSFPHEEPSPVQSQLIPETLGPSFLYSHGFPLALFGPKPVRNGPPWHCQSPVLAFWLSPAEHFSCRYPPTLEFFPFFDPILCELLCPRPLAIFHSLFALLLLNLQSFAFSIHKAYCRRYEVRHCSFSRGRARRSHCER